MSEFRSLLHESIIDFDALRKKPEYQELIQYKDGIQQRLPEISSMKNAVAVCADDRLHEKESDWATLVSRHFENKEIIAFPLAWSWTHLFQRIVSDLIKISATQLSQGHELVALEIVADFLWKCWVNVMTSHSGCWAAWYLWSTHKWCEWVDGDELGWKFSSIVSELMWCEYWWSITIPSGHLHAAPGVSVISQWESTAKLPTNAYYTVWEKGNEYTEADVSLLVNWVIKDPKAPVTYGL